MTGHTAERPTVSRRLRIAHVIIQTVLVWDDGDELSPGPQTTPIAVPLAELDGMAARLRDELPTAEKSALGLAPD